MLYVLHCPLLAIEYHGEPIQANTKHLDNICAKSAQRLRYWSNIVKWYTNVVCLLGYVTETVTASDRACDRQVSKLQPCVCGVISGHQLITLPSCTMSVSLSSLAYNYMHKCILKPYLLSMFYIIILMLNLDNVWASW